MSKDKLRFDYTPGNAVDNYFNSARTSSVGFTKEKAEALIAGHVAAGATGSGLLMFLRKLLAPGPLSMVVVSSALILSSIYYWGADTNQANDPKGPVVQSAPVISKEEDKTDINYAQPDIRMREIDRNNSSGMISKSTKLISKKIGNNPGTRRKEILADPEIVSVKETQPADSFEMAMIKLSNMLYRDSYKLETGAVQPGMMGLYGYDFPGYEPENEGMKTLFNDYIRHKGYAGRVGVKITSMNGEKALLVGGKLLFIMNKDIGVGLAGYGVLTDPQSNKWKGPLPDGFGNLLMGYGGMYVEYIGSSYDLVHWSVGSTFGFGGMGMAEEGVTTVSTHTTAFAVVEPGVDVVVNISNNFRIGAELSYRFTKNMFGNEKFKENPQAVNMDFDGPALGLFIKAGIF